jgi:hypothetical protein
VTTSLFCPHSRYVQWMSNSRLMMLVFSLLTWKSFYHLLVSIASAVKLAFYSLFFFLWFKDLKRNLWGSTVLLEYALEKESFHLSHLVLTGLLNLNLSIFHQLTYSQLNKYLLEYCFFSNQCTLYLWTMD